LTAAEGAGFELLVTADKNLAYQQNLKHRKIALVVLSTPLEHNSEPCGHDLRGDRRCYTC
jgi:hypothetical protein